MWRHVPLVRPDWRHVRDPDTLGQLLRAIGPRRRDLPSVWRGLLSETRTGLRRWVGTDLGERYARAGQHYGEGDFTDPKQYQRTLGDWLHPARPGRPVDVVNAVTRSAGFDVADWRLTRIMSYYAGLEQQPEAPDI